MRRLRTADWLAGGGSAVLLASMFLHWYGVLGGQFAVTAWQAFGVLDIVLALLALVPLALVATQATRESPTIPVAFSVLSSLAGLVATLLILYRILNQPGPNDLVDVEFGAWLGLLSGLAFFLPLLDWARVIGWDAMVGLGLVESLYFVPMGAAMAVVTRMRWWPLWTAALWVGQEAVRGRWPLGGLPWGRLAFSQTATPLTPYASLGGAPLVMRAVKNTARLLSAAGQRAGGGVQHGLTPGTACPLWWHFLLFCWAFRRSPHWLVTANTGLSR